MNLAKCKAREEADENSILVMKDIVVTLTQNILQLTTKLTTLEKNTVLDEVKLRESNEKVQQLSIQTDYLKCQLDMLNSENHLMHLKKKCEKYHSENIIQFDNIKRIRKRLLDVSRKLTKLKESKSILLETQNDYASSISKWQDEILKASKLLYKHIDKIEKDKKVLEKKLAESSRDWKCIKMYLPQMVALCDKAILDAYKKKIEVLSKTKNMNVLEFNELGSESEKESILKDQLQKGGKYKETVKDKLSGSNYFQEKLDELKNNISQLISEKKSLISEHISVIDNFKANEKLMQDKIKLLEHKLHSLHDIKVNFESSLKDEQNSLKTPKTKSSEKELLHEMRELNEVLKLRGDLISRQQETIQKLEKKIEIIEKKELLEIGVKSIVVSTSSICRNEEISRLADVDGSLEERYSKLKIVTSKLKQKCQDQTDVLLKMEDDKTFKNIQALQRENDKLQDEIENLKKNEFIFENIDFQKEKESFVLIKKQMEMEKEALKIQLESKIKEFEFQKIELHKLKAAKKQSNVLSLELEAYEKSLNDVSEKLAVKNKFVKYLESSNETKDDKIQSLNTEIKLLEENLECEKKHAQDLKEQIDCQQEKIKVQEFDKGEFKQKCVELQSTCKQLKSEKDELYFLISEAANENNKLCSSLKTDKEVLIDQVIKLENKVADLKNKFLTNERSLEDFKNEFDSYKFKAQSVLRQNKTNGSSRERELEDQFLDIKTEKETLTIHLKSLANNLDSSNRKIFELRTENERVQQRCKELLESIEVCREQNTLLIDDSKKQNEFYKESLKTHMRQIDTISLCYKEKVEELEKKYQTELLFFKVSNQNVVDFSQGDSFGANIELSSKLFNEQKVDLFLMEREDAEGSDSSTPSILPRRKNSQIELRSKHDAIPLSQLLNSSIELYKNFDDEYQDLASLRDKVSAQENQVKHLTALLAETEQDLAKFTQQNSLLKEEIRRNERAEEREKHMHNSEYLKNVIVKVSF